MLKMHDCTLQEGGHLNRWKFACDNACLRSLLANIVNTGIEIIDIGLLQTVDYIEEGTAVFSSGMQTKVILPKQMRSYVLTYYGDAEELNQMDLCDLNKMSVRILLNYDSDIEEFKKKFHILKNAGFHILVQLRQISLYDKDEMHELLHFIQQLDIRQVCLEDTFGGLDENKFRKLVELFHMNLNNRIILSFRGYNGQLQIESVISKLRSIENERQVIIETSMNGMGRGMGLYNSFQVMAVLNYCSDKKYCVNNKISIQNALYSSVKQITWGHKEELYILSKNNCTYEYNTIIENEKMSLEEVTAIFGDISKSDAIEPNTDLIKKKLKKYRNQKNSFCIILPTADRAAAIHNYLVKQIFRYKNYGIDLIVYDSSTNDITKKVVKKFVRAGADNLYYKRYKGIYDGSLDEKIINAYKEYWDEYEYIWICRDGLIISIDTCYHSLVDLMRKKYELIIVDNVFRDIQNTRNQEYTDPVLLFKDQCIRMVTLGTMILSSDFAKKFIKNIPVDKNTNWSLWQVIGLFQYAAKNPVKTYCYCGDVFWYNEYGTLSSFWNSNGKALWQWGERWYRVVHELPAIYNKEKASVYKIKMYDFNPFGVKQLLIIRGNNGLNLKIIKKYEKYLKHVTETEIWKFKVIACIPTICTRWIVEHYDSLTVKVFRSLYRKIQQFYMQVINNNEIIDYSNEGNYIEKTKLSNFHLIWSNHTYKNKYTFAIFSNDNENALRDTLESIYNQKGREGIDLIIIDDSESTMNLKLVKKYEKYNILYYRQRKTLSREEQYNFAVKVCNTDWIVFLKSGNALYKEYLEIVNHCINHYQKQKTIGAIWNKCNIHYTDEDLFVLKITKRFINKFRLSRITQSEYRLWGNVKEYFIDCGSVFNCEAIKISGGFNSRYGSNSLPALNYKIMQKYAVYEMNMETASCFAENRRSEVIPYSNVNDIYFLMLFRQYINRDFFYRRLWLYVFKNQFMERDIFERLHLPQYYVPNEDFGTLYMLWGYKKNSFKEAILFKKYGLQTVYYKVKHIFTVLNGDKKCFILESQLKNRKKGKKL